MDPIIYYVLSAVTFGEICAAYFLYSKSRNFVSRAFKTTASIKEITQAAEGKRRALISYQDALGKSYEKEIPLILNRPMTAAADTQPKEVDVLVADHDSTIVKQNHFISLWMIPVAMAASAAMLCFVMILLSVTQ